LDVLIFTPSGLKTPKENKQKGVISCQLHAALLDPSFEVVDNDALPLLAKITSL
jgi:hypothetical protein